MAVSYSAMDPAIRLLRDLVAINSVNPTLVPGAPGEQQVADAIAIDMRRIGLDVTVEAAAPGRPNVVGVLEGRSKGRAMMFCGHTDTVAGRPKGRTRFSVSAVFSLDSNRSIARCRPGRPTRCSAPDRCMRHSSKGDGN